MSIKVKICGIKRIADAQHAVSAGADFIGLLVGPNHTSPDHITDELAQEIILSIPRSIETTLIFHTGDIETIVQITRKTDATSITLHEGVEPVDIAKIRDQLPKTSIYKSLYVMDDCVLDEVRDWENTAVDAIHLDTADIATGRRGGTGKLHDWRISARIKRQCQKPVIVAGGLGPDNVAAAVRAIQPYAVDVNTGTRAADGFRDREKVNLFIQQAKAAAQTEAAA